MTILENALLLLGEGFSILPCGARSKKPALEGWKKYQTEFASEAEVRSWFDNGHCYNLAIVCGKVSGNLVVMDCDTKEAFDKFMQTYGAIIGDCPIVRTARGWHIYLRTACLVRSSKREGVDIKAEGGYVLGPGSVHPDGTVYQLMQGDMAHIPTLDPELLGLEDAPTAALPKEETIKEGNRNTSLTEQAGKMRRSGLEFEAIRDGLMVENEKCDPPLPEVEIEAIAKSVARYDPGQLAQGHVKDYGHAEVLAVLLAGKYRYAEHARAFYEWTGKVWEPIPDSRLTKIAADALREKYIEDLRMAKQAETASIASALREACTYYSICGAIALLKGWPGVYARAEQWDRNLWLLNLDNGTIDLHTGALRPHDPADMLTQIAPVAFDGSAHSQKWESHVAMFLPNENIRRQVQRDLGLALVGETEEEALPIWWGSGCNGKSTTAMIITKLFGLYVKHAVPDLLIQKHNPSHPTEIAELHGARIVFSSEIGKGKKMDEQRVKSLTGGEVKRARFMHQDNIDVLQTFTVFLLTNEKPSIIGVDRGIWRRIRLCPWTFSIEDQDKRPQSEVIAEIVAEGSGVLNWFLAGLTDWQHDPKWKSGEVVEATKAYQEEENRIGPFLADRCETGKGFSISMADLAFEYEAWCTDTGEEPLSKRMFGKLLMESTAVTKGRTEKSRRWIGIRLAIARSE